MTNTVLILLAISNVLAWLCIFSLFSRLQSATRGLLLLLKDRQQQIVKAMQSDFDAFIMDMDAGVADVLRKAAAKIEEDAKKKAGKKIKIDRE